MELNVTITPTTGTWEEAQNIIKKIRESQVAEFAEIHVEVKGVTSHDGISNTASNHIDAIYRKHFHPRDDGGA